jgi:hypothetical protein
MGGLPKYCGTRFGRHTPCLPQPPCRRAALANDCPAISLPQCRQNGRLQVALLLPRDPVSKALQWLASAGRQGLAAGPLETGRSISHTLGMAPALLTLSVSILMFAGCFWVAYWLDKHSKGSSY